MEKDEKKILTKYGNLNGDKYKEYLNYLVDKTYKILVLKEEGNSTLDSYLADFLYELIGNQELVAMLKEEPCYISVITKINYLKEKNPETAVYKKQVFKCIHLLKDIRCRMFGE